MEKVCAKMVPKMLSAEQKELKEEICSFAMYMEWTRFVEVRNYLWWDLDIYVRPRNKMTDNALEVTKLPKREKKKITLVIQSSWQCCLFSLMSRLLWWQSGFPVARLSISTIEILIKLHEHVRRKWPGLWRNGGFCFGTMCHPITLCL